MPSKISFDFNLSEDQAHILRALGIEYTRGADGTLVVPGSIDLSRRGLMALPDLSRVIVMGDFSCRQNLLTTLKGAPKEVGGHFDCEDSLLKSLAGAPRRVGGDFRCLDNNLRDLKGAPETVGGSFFCNLNKLVSLEGAPAIRAYFVCHANLLKNLEHAPKSCISLKSDFGTFASWLSVPEHLRSSAPEAEKFRRPGWY